jgi:hypothetical protein
VFRIANVNGAGNTFELEGVDSTNYDTFTSGTFQVITFGNNFGTIREVSASGGEAEDDHRPVELRAHEVVDHRAARTAYDPGLVAGARVEREREPELLGDRPERVVGAVVVRTRRHLGGEEERAAVSACA